MSKRTRRRRQFDDTKTLIPYCRQSRARDNEQAGTALSLDAQETMIREWGQRNEYTVEEAIRDHDEDSEAIDRAGLRSLYTRVRPGVTVAVELWDRLGRGWPLSAINAEVEKLGGRTISVTQGSDPLSREMHGMMGGQYLVQLSDRLHSVARTRVERGQHVGATPYGYDRPLEVPYVNKHGAAKIRKSGPLIVDPDEADVVRLIFARLLAGDSLRVIAQTLESQGIATSSGGPWVPQTVSWILHNPVYAGGVRMGDRVNWNGLHPAIIDRKTFDTAADYLVRTPVVKVTHERHWCEGYVRHECGARMNMNMVSRPGGGRYPSYRCSNNARIDHQKCDRPRQHIGAPLLDRAVRECLALDVGNLVPLERAMRMAVDEAGGTGTARERQRLTAQREEVLRVMNRAKILWRTGTDDLETWKAEEREFTRQIAEIDRAARDLPTEPNVVEMQASYATLAAIPAHSIAKVSPDVLRELIARLGVIVVTTNGVRIDYHRRYRIYLSPHTVAP